MTSQVEAQEANGPAERTEPQRFAIDMEWYRKRGVSLEELLKARRCPSSQKKIQGRGGSITYQAHLQEIARCCSKKEDYLADWMPLMEVMFRTLLAGGNKPRTAEEIHQELSAHLETRTYSRVLPLHWVERMLSGSNQYGIFPVRE